MSRVHVAHAHAHLLQIVGEILRHPLRERRDEHALAASLAQRICAEQIVDLPAHRAHLDLRIDEPRRTNDLLDDDALGQLQLELARRRRHEERARRERQELVEHQRPVVERARQTESVVDERQLARAIAVEHAADLRQRDVRLVDDHEEILGEVVEEARRALARLRGPRDGASSSRCRRRSRPRASSRCRSSCATRAAAPRAACPALRSSSSRSTSSARMTSTARSSVGPRRDEVLRRIDRSALELAIVSPVTGRSSRSSRPRRPTSRCARPAPRTPERSRPCRRARGTLPRSKDDVVARVLDADERRRMSSRPTRLPLRERHHLLAILHRDRRGRRCTTRSRR